MQLFASIVTKLQKKNPILLIHQEQNHVIGGSLKIVYFNNSYATESLEIKMILVVIDNHYSQNFSQ